MRALLIEFDLRTGKRAGDISPRDPKLPCHGWQDLESEPAIEIRLVEDDRDLSIYNGIAGVTVLEGAAAINQAITANVPIKYAVKDKELLLAHLKERGVSLDTLAGKNLADNLTAKGLYSEGLAGIVERKPKLV